MGDLEPGRASATFVRCLRCGLVRIRAAGLEIPGRLLQSSRRAFAGWTGSWLRPTQTGSAYSIIIQNVNKPKANIGWLSLKCLPTARSAHPDPPLFRAKPTASSRSARRQQTRNGLFCAVSRWVHASETKYAGSRISETHLCASCARRTLSEDATEETGGNTNTEASAARQPVSEYVQLASHSLHFPPFCLLFTRGSCWFLRARAGSCGRMSAQRAAELLTLLHRLLKFHTLIPKLHREVLVCCPCSVIHLTPAQVAQRLGMKERTLERWRNLGIGPPYLRLPAACVTASKTSRLTSAVTCAAALLSISTDSGGAGLKPHASVATQPFAHPVLDFRNLSPFCCFLAARRWRALPAACG